MPVYMPPVPTRLAGRIQHYRLNYTSYMFSHQQDMNWSRYGSSTCWETSRRRLLPPNIKTAGPPKRDRPANCAEPPRRRRRRRQSARDPFLVAAYPRSGSPAARPPPPPPPPPPPIPPSMRYREPRTDCRPPAHARKPSTWAPFPQSPIPVHPAYIRPRRGRRRRSGSSSIQLPDLLLLILHFA